MTGKNSLSISSSSIGHFRHATLLFTALLLIATNGCAANEKVDLKDRCMKYPLHLMCRGSVMKRGVPKLRNFDMIFDDYMRTKISRNSDFDEYPNRRYNPLNKLNKKERENLYEYYLAAKQAKLTNRSKLLERLLRSDGDESPAPGSGRNARDADSLANTIVDSYMPFLDNFEYK